MLGLPAAVAAGFVPVESFLGLPAEFSLGALPDGVLIDLAGFLVAGLVLLVGGLATLFRATAGAVLLGVGAVLALAALLAEPLVVNVPLAQYVDTLFARGGLETAARVVLAALAALVLVLASVPTTFRHLRYRTPPRPVFPAQRA